MRYDLQYRKETNFTKVKTYKEMAKKALEKVANFATIAKVTKTFCCKRKDK